MLVFLYALPKLSKIHRMSDVVLFGKAVLIGLAVAAPPIGGIGVLCIRRSLTRGFSAGFSTGMGATTADALFAVAAIFGLSQAVPLLGGWLIALQIVGSLFLVYLGHKTYRSPLARTADDTERSGAVWNFGSAFFVVVTNPVAILTFVTMFAAIGYATDEPSVLAPLGVFLGGTLWWSGLSLVMSRVGACVKPSSLTRINAVCGVILVVLGVLGILSAFR